MQSPFSQWNTTGINLYCNKTHPESETQLIKDMQVNISKYYPDLAGNPYPEYLSEAPENGFKVGDLLFDEANSAIGMVLGCIDYKGGELRLDSDGMRPIEDLRHATVEDIQGDTRRDEYLKNELINQIEKGIILSKGQYFTGTPAGGLSVSGSCGSCNHSTRFLYSENSFGQLAKNVCFECQNTTHSGIEHSDINYKLFGY